MTSKNKAKTTSPSSVKTSIASVSPSHASKILVDIDDIGVTYGDETVLRDVSFCVHKGDFIGLIGPNGAGKTTLLRVLLGLQTSTSGRVHREDVQIGYVPQRGATYSGLVPMSVLEVVSLGSKGSTLLARESLKRVQLSNIESKRFTELSGGQQQRVSIAKALAANADILILDEPAAGIDDRAQLAFYELLNNLQSQGVTIVLVSHEVDTVLRLVNRVICLNRSILYDGPPEHFEAEKYMPRSYQEQHVKLHHQHGGDHA